MCGLFILFLFHFPPLFSLKIDTPPLFEVLLRALLITLLFSPYKIGTGVQLPVFQAAKVCGMDLEIWDWKTVSSILIHHLNHCVLEASRE